NRSQYPRFLTQRLTLVCAPRQILTLACLTAPNIAFELENKRPILSLYVDFFFAPQ
ncbi:MAG: hypothetical protein ACI9C4_003205, partial [Paraglaciecola sp.]